MNTFQLDNTINNMMNMLNDTEDDINTLPTVMALIDERYNLNDTPEQYNNRLRNSISNNFNKCLLTNDKSNLFRIWENKLNNLPKIASRMEIFSQAPLNALYIVGL